MKGVFFREAVATMLVVHTDTARGCAAPLPAATACVENFLAKDFAL